MKNKLKISVAIATYNESHNIKKCLDSVAEWVDEIVIVDGNSHDNTVAIAKDFSKVKVITTDNKPMFHLNKQRAIDNCQGNWILQLDADETVSEQLAKEIQTIISEDPKHIDFNGFWINRRNYFLGRFLSKGGQYPDATIRLYKNGKGKLPCLSVHEQAKINGQVGSLKSDLLHFADISFSRYCLRLNRYTTLIAQELIDKDLKITLFTFLNYYLIKPLYWFALAYFRHKGFVDGFPGFVFAYFSSLRFPIAFTKFWELKINQRTSNLTNDWDS